VARYTLDELYGTKKTDLLIKLPRKEITEELREYLNEKMEEVGITILGGGVGAELIPKNEKIVEQRVNTWKAGWAERLETQQGESEAVYLRESERVRIRILNELIELAQIVKKTSDDNKRALLTARLMEMLGNIARDLGDKESADELEEGLEEEALHFLQNAPEEP
jgi:hypothetical protein